MPELLIIKYKYYWLLLEKYIKIGITFYIDGTIFVINNDKTFIGASISFAIKLKNI